MSDASPPPLTSRGYEFLAVGLVGVNIVGWFVLLLLYDLVPAWASTVVASVLSLPIAWPIVLVYHAADSLSHIGDALVIAMSILILFPWLWLNAGLWGRGLAIMIRWMVNGSGK